MVTISAGPQEPILISRPVAGVSICPLPARSGRSLSAPKLLVQADGRHSISVGECRRLLEADALELHPLESRPATCRWRLQEVPVRNKHSIRALNLGVVRPRIASDRLDALLISRVLTGI
ncbi:hypothetical protein D3C71_1590130 [compost metagenome]